MVYGRKLGMAVMCFCLSGGVGVSANAADVTANHSQGAVVQSTDIELAAVEPRSQVVSRQVNADPLHADPHWPLFKNCIDNTANRGAFDACLQMAFLGGSPDSQTLALLTR